MSLKKYLEEVNARNAIFDKEAAPLVNPVSVAECDVLLNRLEGDLSPENVACDGEASPAYVKARMRLLTAAQKTLNNMRAKFVDADAKAAIKEPVADKPAEPAKEKKLSNAAKVRQHVEATYDTQEDAMKDFAAIVEKAMAFGIKTKSAARQCVTSNIPKVFA